MADTITLSTAENLGHAEIALKLARTSPNDLDAWLETHLAQLNDVFTADSSQPLNANTYAAPMVSWWLCQFLHTFAKAVAAGDPPVFETFLDGIDLGIFVEGLFIEGGDSTGV